MKASERQMLKHDKYADTVVSGLQWAKKHQSKMIAIGAAVVIVAGAIVWTVHSRMQAQEDAQTQLTQYEASADSALRMKGDARAEAIKDALSTSTAWSISIPTRKWRRRRSFGPRNC